VFRIGMRVPLLTLLLLTLPSVLAAQIADDDSADSPQAMAAWIDSVAAFTKDVRFDEVDVRRFLELWPDFEQIEDLQEDDDEDVDDLVDFRSLLDREEYRTWARLNDVDPEAWLRRSMRIVAVMMRDRMMLAADASASGFAEQLQALKTSPDGTDTELAERMEAAAREGAAVMRQMAAAAARLPKPTDAEQAALDAHQDELAALLGADDDAWAGGGADEEE